MSICSSKAKYLILDGIGTGSDCLKSKSSYENTIPSCMLSLSEVISLQLAGNGLQGSLPDIPASSSLRQLSLARNQLTG